MNLISKQMERNLKRGFFMTFKEKGETRVRWKVPTEQETWHLWLREDRKLSGGYFACIFCVTY